MSTVDDIQALRKLGWPWTRIAAHYGVSEREVRRWTYVDEATGATYDDVVGVPRLAPPLVLRYATALVVNDTQYPHHDPALWEVTCQIARDAEVETIVYNGDMLDFEQLSSFKFDEFKTKTAAEDVEGFHRELRQPLLKACESAIGYKPDEHWVNGNHEDRYDRFMEHHANNLGEADPVRFLGLQEVDTFYPYGPRVGHYLTPKLACAHGWATAKSSAGKNHIEGMGCSVIFGHTHRISSGLSTTADGVLGYWECGHMTIPEKVPGTHGKGKPDWQLVAGTLVRYARKGESFDVDILNTFGDNDERVIANGKEYRIDR